MGGKFKREGGRELNRASEREKREVRMEIWKARTPGERGKEMLVYSRLVGGEVKRERVSEQKKNEWVSERDR